MAQFMARFTANSNHILILIRAFLTRSIPILADVMKWGWIRALKKKQQARTTIAIWHGIYKTSLKKESVGIGAQTRGTPI